MLMRDAAYHASITPCPDGGYSGNPAVVALVEDYGDRLEGVTDEKAWAIVTESFAALGTAKTMGNHPAAQQFREAIALVAMAIAGW